MKELLFTSIVFLFFALGVVYLLGDFSTPEIALSTTGFAAMLQGGNIYDQTYRQCTQLASQFGGQYVEGRCAMCAQLNVYRQRNGRAPLVINPYLMKTAQWWSEVQAYHGAVGHPEASNAATGNGVFVKYQFPPRHSGLFCSTQQNTGVFPSQMGIQFATIGAVNEAWPSSQGHNENMLDNWKFVGCGLATGRCDASVGGGSCFYSTTDFAG